VLYGYFENNLYEENAYDTYVYNNLLRKPIYILCLKYSWITSVFAEVHLNYLFIYLNIPGTTVWSQTDTMIKLSLGRKQKRSLILTYFPVLPGYFEINLFGENAHGILGVLTSCL
jgi:hypothetical protein